MSKIVMFSHRPIFQEGLTSGPGIRVFEIAKALQKKGHKVSIAEPKRKQLAIKDNINFISWNNDLLLNIQKKFDVAILQTWNDEIDFLNKLKKIPKVVDLYSPTLIEHANFCIEKTKFESYYKKGKINYFYDDVITNLSRIIMAGDFFICANKQQKAFYIGIFSILGKINPKNYDKNILDIVPFGIPEEKLNKNLKELKIKKEKDDLFILWPGGISPWFDAITLIKAMKILEKKNPKIKLVFVGANNSLDSHFTKEGFNQAKKLTKQLKLLNINIFFCDWISYHKRASMYNETKLAVILAKKGFENEISHRTRIIDCIWGEIPIISSSNSEVSDIIQRNDLGFIVSQKNEQELAEKIIKLINNKPLRNKIIDNIKHYKEKLFWSKLISSLDSFCKQPTLSKTSSFNSYNLLSEKQKSIEICENQLVVKDDELNTKNNQINNYYKHIQNKDEQIKQQNKHIQNKDEQIKQQNKHIQNKDEQIKQQNKHLLNKHKEIIESFKIIENQKEIIIKQRTTITKFQKSIVYSLYKITSKFGNTKIGKIVQKKLK